MQIDRFVQARQADWKQLEQLVARSQRSASSLTLDEVKTLASLYRAATSDLALAQRDFPQHRVTFYLNQLVAQGHAVIYRSEPFSLNRFWRFIREGFPRAYREAWPFILVASLLLLVPALMAAILTAWQPETAQWLLPADAQHLIADIQRQDLWTDIAFDKRPYASSFIMQNNIQIAFLAFAGGVLAAVPTVLVLINNGLLLGAITGLTAHYGIGFDLWTFIIGHGVIELTVIGIAGGSGLILGWAIISPGLLSRRDSLTLAARKAVRLIIGCVPLLVLAGLIEGFLSPAEGIPWPVKWVVGIGSGVCLYSYLLLAGRPSRRERRLAALAQ